MGALPSHTTLGGIDSSRVGCVVHGNPAEGSKYGESDRDRKLY